MGTDVELGTNNIPTHVLFIFSLYIFAMHILKE